MYNYKEVKEILRDMFLTGSAAILLIAIGFFLDAVVNK